MGEFRMPALGADMEDGTLAEWMVKPGDKVGRGDIIAVVETEKGAIEVEIFDEGIVSEIVVPVGTKVPVGAVLALIGDGAATPVRPPRQPEPAALPIRATRPAGPAPLPVQTVGARAKITPAARRRAAELGLDSAAIAGTGVDGSVTLADVEAAGAPVLARPSAATAPRPSGFDPAEMRKAIAAAMTHAKRDIPHYYLTHTIDLGPALSWLETFNQSQPVTQRLLPAALLLKASALALRDVPQLNGTYVKSGFQPGAGIHAGWAISLRGGGLVAPAIRDTDRKSLPELMTAMRDLVQRARTGRLRSSELQLPTVTVTSLGDRGAESVTGIIYPPQTAIIGFGAILTRPWVVGDRVEPRPVAVATLAADHRVTDGHVGGLLLNAIEHYLKEPETL